jgi:hypothetical protein
MSYATLFTRNHKATQTKDDRTLAWAGIDWDVRQRTPAVVAIADAASADVLSSLPPITGPESLNAVASAIAQSTPVLRSRCTQAMTAAGWATKRHAYLRSDAQNVTVTKSVFGLAGHCRRRVAWSMHAATTRFGGAVVTVTPTALPILTAT